MGLCQLILGGEYFALTDSHTSREAMRANSITNNTATKDENLQSLCSSKFKNDSKTWIQWPQEGTGNARQQFQKIITKHLKG